MDLGKDVLFFEESSRSVGRFRGGAQLTVDTVQGAGLVGEDIDTQGIPQSPRGHRAVDVNLGRGSGWFAQIRLHPVFVDRDEMPQGAVVGPFRIIRKQTCRELFHAPVILETFAAHAFPAAGIIGTVAVRQVLLFLTFVHSQVLGIQVFRYDFFQGDFCW